MGARLGWLDHTNSGERASVRPARAILPALLAVAAVAAAGFAAVLLWSFFPASPFCGPGCIDKRLEALTAPDGGVPAPRLQQARALVRRQLAFSPVDATAWLRLAALETQAAGRPDAAALDALRLSYRYAPTDASISRWRIGFTFEHWDVLPPDVRSATEREIADLMVSPANIVILQEAALSIRNPAGRLACLLILQRYRT